MRPLPVLAGLLVLPSLAVATSLIPHTLLQRAEQADRVVLVQVLSQKVEETKGAEIPLKTLTKVAVGQDLRGTGPSELTIVQLGGNLGLRRPQPERIITDPSGYSNKRLSCINAQP